MVMIGPEATVIHNEIIQPKLGDGLIGVNLTLDMKQVQGGELGSSSRLNGEPTVPAMKEQEPQSVLTRKTDPWKPEHVERILRKVTLRWGITETEHDTAWTTITEFADCFALSIKEVNAIPGAVHKLNIPEGTTFRTKIPPRSYNPDQRAFMEVKIDEMLEAGVIRKIHPRDVWCVAQTVLAQKTHKGEGLTLDELKHCVNNQCIEHGLPSEFEMPPQP